MSLAYLTEPTKQWQDISGVNAVGGHISVYLANTDDLATTFKDFSGTLNPAEIPIDNAGRAVIIADSSRPYRIEFYGRDGGLIFTQQPVWTLASGSGGSYAVNIESTDGSIDVDKTVIGGAVNFDLGMAADDSQYLDWVKCVGATAGDDGVLIPQKSEGTMHMSASGIILRANQLYHITTRFSATKTSTEPFYDNITLAFRTYDGETDSVVHQENRIIDYSLGLVQEFEVSADIKVGDANTSLRFAYGAQDVRGGEIRLVSADVHRIFSGISRAAGSLVQEQADWTEANPAAPSYIKNKPQNLVQDAAYVHTDNNFTTAEKDKLSGIETGAEVNVQANWTEANSSSDAYIQNKPQNLVQDADYVHTDNNFTSAYKDKLSGIAAGAEVNVQANWTETNSSSDAYIQNKPNLATVATSGSYNDLTDKPTIPAAQVNSDWNASSGVAEILNKPNLATVATSGSYNDLSNKPSIPAAQVNSDWNASSGVSAILNKPNLATVATSGSYNDLSSKPTIPAAQVQADWTEADSAAVDYIKNKPNLATVATSGSYNDLSNKPSIPAAQVNSDWNAASGVAQILNKPSLAAVATSGAYSDLSGTPTIPAAANNGVLTITQNGTSKGTFSANQPGNNTIALTDTTYSAGVGIAIDENHLITNQGVRNVDWSSDQKALRTISGINTTNYVTVGNATYAANAESGSTLETQVNKGLKAYKESIEWVKSIQGYVSSTGSSPQTFTFEIGDRSAATNVQAGIRTTIGLEAGGSLTLSMSFGPDPWAFWTAWLARNGVALSSFTSTYGAVGTTPDADLTSEEAVFDFPTGGTQKYATIPVGNGPNPSYETRAYVHGMVKFTGGQGSSGNTGILTLDLVYETGLATAYVWGTAKWMIVQDHA